MKTAVLLLVAAVALSGCTIGAQPCEEYILYNDTWMSKLPGETDQDCELYFVYVIDQDNDTGDDHGP